MENPKLTITTPRGSVCSVKSKNGSIRAELKWNPGFGPAMTNSMNNAQKYIDTEVLRRCDPMVPFKTGMLKQSGQLGTNIGSGIVQYIASYATRMYYAKDFKFNGAPTRGAQWFERMKAYFREVIMKGAAAIAGKER